MRKLPVLIRLLVVASLVLAASPAVGRVIVIYTLDFSGAVSYNDEHLQGVGTPFVTGYWLYAQAGWWQKLITSRLIIDLETVPYEPNYLPLADLSSWSYLYNESHGNLWWYEIGTGAVCPGELTVAEGILTNSYVGPHAMTVGLSRVPGTASGVRITLVFRQKWELSGAFGHPECAVLPEYNKVIPTFLISESRFYSDITELMNNPNIFFEWQTLADGLTSWNGYLVFRIFNYSNPPITTGALMELLLKD
jgi:hypothetical protein